MTQSGRLGERIRAQPSVRQALVQVGPKFKNPNTNKGVLGAKAMLNREVVNPANELGRPGRYYEPTLRQAFPTCIAVLLVAAILGLSAHNAGSGFAAAGNAPPQSALPGTTTLTSHVLAQNVTTNVRTVGSSATPAYPVKASANNRYLVDQNGVPFLMVGDSPQNLITNLSQAEAARYMANRRTYGINTLWINLLCIRLSSAACNEEATTVDGIAPFTIVGDLSSPNPAYFRRADEMIRIAATNSIVVLLDPIETISWLNILRTNGTAKAFAYGQYLGNRYRDFPNIIWMHGNDFQSWENASDNALVQAVARGIRSVDTNHLHTVELNFFTSGSLDDPSWAGLIELNAAYTYFPTYAQVLTEYNRSNFKPVFMAEANYEFEHNAGTDGGSTLNLRKQEYWTMLSGAAGQVYGSAHTWQLKKGWESNLDTPGVMQLNYMKNLFVSRQWYDLVPDQTHTVVTAGYGRLSCFVGKLLAYVGRGSKFVPRALVFIRKYSAVGSITTNTCATTARTSDGSLVMVYMPSIRTVTVDMSKLAALTMASWYDPTNGEYAPVGGSPFANTGSRQLTPPGNNSSGDGDWVLVLEASTAH
jgi:uncharacterized protein DUF4038/collagenase-like protein with putative collagen-binding domain